MATITKDIVADAKEFAGNMFRIENFGWFGRRDDDFRANWTLVHIGRGNQSTLIDESNAAHIAKTLAPFMDGDEGDVVPVSIGSSLVGSMDAYTIRVYRYGEITPAFETYWELRRKEDDYPVLDEDDYSNREYEATMENITDAAKHGRTEQRELPDGWEGEVYSWFSDNDQSAIENRDDQGGYPDDEQLESAFDALGYPVANVA